MEPMSQLGSTEYFAGSKNRRVSTIAVLPFVSLDDNDDQYFGEGLTEELINALTQFKGVKVVSRAASFQFKGKAKDISEVGRRLGVGTVLDGSVRRSGNRLRVTAELIDSTDGYQLWSQKFDREMTDLFAIQDEVTSTIVEKLKVQLATGSELPLTPRRTENLVAYNLYLKGRYYLNRRDLRRSVECLEKAAAEDPDYALPWAAMAEAFNLMSAGAYEQGDPTAAVAQARAAALKATELDEACAEAHVALGLLYFRTDWNWLYAEKEFRRALELSDQSSPAHHQLAMFLAAVGRIEEALAEVNKARELDPLSPIHHRDRHGESAVLCTTL